MINNKVSVIERCLVNLAFTDLGVDELLSYIEDCYSYLDINEQAILAKFLVQTLVKNQVMFVPPGFVVSNKATIEFIVSQQEFLLSKVRESLLASSAKKDFQSLYYYMATNNDLILDAAQKIVSQEGWYNLQSSQMSLYPITNNNGHPLTLIETKVAEMNELTSYL